MKLGGCLLKVAFGDAIAIKMGIIVKEGVVPITFFFFLGTRPTSRSDRLIEVTLVMKGLWLPHLKLNSKGSRVLNHTQWFRNQDFQKRVVLHPLTSHQRKLSTTTTKNCLEGSCND